jgi:nucleoside-diphosphate-sugar epimerase
MLHIAALVGPFFNIPLYLKVNYQGTLNVMDACKAAGIGALVDCSSPSTRFDGSDIRGMNEDEVWKSLNERYQGLHEYARTKALGEGAVLRAAKETELSTCAVAPHQVYGPSDRLFLPALLKNARKGVLRVMGYGNNCVSFTHESNIAHALLLAAGALVAHEDWKKAGRPDTGKLAVLGKAGAKVNGEYMVVTDATDEHPAGLAINFWDAIEDAMIQTGIGSIRSGSKGLCRLPYYGLLLPIAYAGKLFTAITGRFVNITPFTIRMLIIDRYFDIGKAKVLLGYKPLVSFNDPKGWKEAVKLVYERTAKEEGW